MQPRLWEAQSTDVSLRARQGGGVITSLLVHLMESGMVSEALVVASSSHEPWARPMIARSIEEVRAAAGSKYVFVPYGDLPTQLGPRSAMVGLPCQFDLSSSADPIRLGIFCGLAISRRGIRYLLQQLGVRAEDVEALDYRAPGGGLLVNLKNGREVRFRSYYWLSYFFSNPQCIACTDNTAHNSDLSVGDRRREWSSVIVRTQRGEQVFLDAIGEGRIVANEISQEDFLSFVKTPYFQKELGGGYSRTRWVRVRGRWAEFIPLEVLRRVGVHIARRTGRR